MLAEAAGLWNEMAYQRKLWVPNDLLRASSSAVQHCVSFMTVVSRRHD
jgi:hypothetical protein